MTVPAYTQNGQSSVRMTPAAIDALHSLARPQAESVARAIAAIGHADGEPVTANGRRYYAMAPDDDEAPVVMYRAADHMGYLVTALGDPAAYQTYEIARHPGFLQSNAFKSAAAAVVAAAIGVILGVHTDR